MPVRPMLGNLELHRVQKIEIDGDQILIQHDIPGLEGDFLQRMERGAARVRLVGALLGSEEVSDELKKLRDAFYAAEPVTFVSDIATATRIDQVVIEEMGVRELAGKPFYLEYAFTLVEFTELEPPKEKPNPPPPIIITPESNLIVEVSVEVNSVPIRNYDYSNVTVRVEGTPEGDPNPLNETLPRSGNTAFWEKTPFPSGTFTATATTSDPQAMTGSKVVTVPEVGTGKVKIILEPSKSHIAKVFIVHFWFDKAFIEPCLRPVLNEIADYAKAHPQEKMVILGHTDLTRLPRPNPSEENYNDYLADRRARSVYAYLTYGRDKAAALEEWQRLREKRTPGNFRSLNDTWDVREYQHMLQDLNYYIGNIDEVNGPMTRQAIHDFKINQGITPVNHVMTDETWDKLIENYLDVEPLSVPEDKFFKNCPSEVLKWQGCGEYDPVVNTRNAERRNRRTEIIFVKAEKLPRKMKKPFTFEMPTAGAVNSAWCLDQNGVTESDDYPATHCCVVVPNRKKLNPPVDPCPPTGEEDRWDRQYLSNDLVVKGQICYVNGTPAAGVEYVLTAPNGHYLTGEYVSGSKRGRPIRKKTDENGYFVSEHRAPKGHYILEVFGPYAIVIPGQPVEEMKGNIVCQRIEASDDEFKAILIPFPLGLSFVEPNHTDKQMSRVMWKQPFRLRADIPGLVGDEVEVDLSSYLIRR